MLKVLLVAAFNTLRVIVLMIPWVIRAFILALASAFNPLRTADQITEMMTHRFVILGWPAYMMETLRDFLHPLSWLFIFLSWLLVGFIGGASCLYLM